MGVGLRVGALFRARRAYGAVGRAGQSPTPRVVGESRPRTKSPPVPEGGRGYMPRCQAWRPRAVTPGSGPAGRLPRCQAWRPRAECDSRLAAGEQRTAQHRLQRFSGTPEETEGRAWTPDERPARRHGCRRRWSPRLPVEPRQGYSRFFVLKKCPSEKGAACGPARLIFV